MNEDERAQALASVEREYAELLESALWLESLGEPWAGAIAQQVGRVGFEIRWFKQERERRAVDAVALAKEQR